MKRKLSIAILTIAATISMSIPAHAADCRNTGQTVCVNDLLQLLRQCNPCGSPQTDCNWILNLWMQQGNALPGGESGPQQEEAAKPQPEKPIEPQSEEPAKPDSQPETPEASEISSERSYEQEVVRLVNLERAKNGLPELTEDVELSRIARLKSRDMHDNGYFDHTSPTYGTPFQMMRSFGISYRSAGENIAMGYATPQSVVNAWMNSPGHRANILNASYTKIGVGLYERYWTQHFIG